MHHNQLALSVAETAELISVSKPTVYRLMRQADDPLPSFKVGTRTIIPLLELKNWVSRQAEKGAQLE